MFEDLIFILNLILLIPVFQPKNMLNETCNIIRFKTGHWRKKNNPAINNGIGFKALYDKG
jgi:hypothetical protein